MILNERCQDLARRNCIVASDLARKERQLSIMTRRCALAEATIASTKDGYQAIKKSLRRWDRFIERQQYK